MQEGKGEVIINAKPPAAQASASMINTGGQQPVAPPNDTVAEMPMQFQLYSDLTSKVFGGEGNR